MSGVTTADLLGGYRPIDELASAAGYRQPRSMLKKARDLGVPIVVIKRKPHAHPDEFQAALKREAERAIQSTSPRGRGRPRKAD